MPMLASDILWRLEANPPLASVLEFSHVQRFLDVTVRIWPDIVGRGGVPVALPRAPTAFLSAMLQLPPDIITLAWAAFGDAAAELHASQTEAPAASINDEFRLHGWDHGIGEYFCAPVRRSRLRPLRG